MTPKLFLRIAGIALITIGILGIVGLFGKISSASFFHPPYWINWVHLGWGMFVLSISIWGNRRWQVGLTLAATIWGLALGIAGLLLGSWAAQRFAIPELADPSDHVAHLTVGVLALWGWRSRTK